MSEQKRILIFTHDGRGLGHLRRLGRLAGQLQGPKASVLFVTGHRAAAHLVPASCEFVHLPSMDSIDRRRARHWGRMPFLENDLARGRIIRQRLLTTTMETFQPHGFIADYLPLGMDQELGALLNSYPETRKYFIMRGILDDPNIVMGTVLNPQSMVALEQNYDLLLAGVPGLICTSGEERHWTRRAYGTGKEVPA